jgi:hypothetical protein
VRDPGDEHADFGYPPPTPTQHAESFARSFVGLANELALLYGGPVYLVGSMLTTVAPGDSTSRRALQAKR